MENPRPSQAWKTDELESFMTQHHAMKVFIDMCYFGLKAANGLFHRKSTQLVTSMQAVISNMLGCQCPGDHAHAPVIGGSKVTAIAGHYTAAFADALVDSFLEQFDFESSLMWKDPLDLDFEVNSTEHVHEANAGEAGESDGDEELGLKPEDSKITITPAVRQAVMRLHINTGHRSNLRLARALLVAGAPREAVVAAKRLSCSICAERQPPRPRLPASLPPARQVGQQAHIDLMILDDSVKRPHTVAHITDSVSRFQAARVLKDKSSAEVIQFLVVH